MLLFPRLAASLITLLLHLPLMVIGVQLVLFPSPPPVPAAEVAIGLHQALELAFLRPPKWHIKVIDLPELLSDGAPPPIPFSSRVLIDAKEGKIVWSEPHPVVTAYLSQLIFANDGGPRYRWGYLSIAP